MTNPKTKTLFLDRDGVIIEDRHYVHKIEDLFILPGVPEALELAQTKGFRIVSVTNQSGVARGMFGMKEVHALHHELNQRLVELKAPVVETYYVCPHHKAGSVAAFSIDCDCRKPKVGLLEQADRDHPVDWSQSVIVGDKISDVDCGKAKGIKSIQIDHKQYPVHDHADHVVSSLLEAVKLL